MEVPKIAPRGCVNIASYAHVCVPCVRCLIVRKTDIEYKWQHVRARKVNAHILQQANPWPYSQQCCNAVSEQT